jgi:hypothetical protein
MNFKLILQSGWDIKSTSSNSEWKDVDLSDDWAEYDNSANVSVGVYLPIESKFERA